MATVIIAVVALALIGVAFTMSYAALYEAATWLADTQLHAINDGDLRFLFPLGIDAVIVYFLAMDLLMEWQGRRHALNRWSAYALSAITVILNVSQGDGSTASYLGHAGPPIVIILIAEGVAAWIRHLAGLAHGQAVDRIPVGRWIAHPVSTLKVVRLMLGWGITSYPQALEYEQRRQLAYAMLREQHGYTWRRHTPRHLRWMLDNGYELDTAFELTRAMTAATVAMTAAEVARVANPSGQDRESLTAGLSDQDTTPEYSAVEGTAAFPASEDPTPQTHTNDHPRPAVAPIDPRPAPAEAEENPLARTTPPPNPPTPQTPLAQDASSQVASAPAPGEEPSAPDRPAHQGQETLAPRQLSAEQKRQRIRELLRSSPEITDAELAQHIDSSPRTVRRYRAELGYQRSPVNPRGHHSGHETANESEGGHRKDSDSVLATTRSQS
ncbi:DUF2637 domain-containing protein [Nocardiopsis dassonvillei]|uniref:DUF2637 domain-containing protein n=1 Tax=Nocardiopsis dassonvillei TaxID=2014 RepID=UPI00366E0D63